MYCFHKSFAGGVIHSLVDTILVVFLSNRNSFKKNCKALRKAKNAVDRHEKAIAQLEAKQEELNAAMAAVDPSDRTKVTELAYAYDAVQKEMQDSINAWEKALEEVERLSAD